ncbi:MAG: 30S ribosomal protein S8 [Deltaproteobacteria bacterium]|nr:30S ribosomal protein S8 [Deltaproteobacteria bacterium]
MCMTDPLADMLTRIRNGNMAKFTKVDMPSSKIKVNVAKVLKNEGYIKNFKLIKDRKQGILRIFMKYDADNSGVITGIQRISKPSRRTYVAVEKIPSVKNGLGISILSTSKGVLADKQAKKVKAGGEVLCAVW